MLVLAALKVRSTKDEGGSSQNIQNPMEAKDSERNVAESEVVDSASPWPEESSQKIQNPMEARDSERNAAESEVVDSASRWPDLPSDMLNNVADRLTNLDFFAIREVCRSWRRGVPLSRERVLSLSLPVRIPSLDPRYWRENSARLVCRRSCTLSTGSVYALRAPSGPSSSSSQSVGFFLLFVEEFDQGRLWLRNPLSLPVVCESPFHVPEKLNLLEFDAVEVAKFHSLISYSGQTHSKLPYYFSEHVIKVVVLSSGLYALFLADTGMLRVYNIESIEWGIIHDGDAFKFDDIVECNGEVFGIDRRGRLHSIIYNGDMMWGTKILGIRNSGGVPGGGRRKRLVVSYGELYMLARCLGPDVRHDSKLKVFKLRLEDRRWVRETNLDGGIFFVGPFMSFSMSAEALGGNCRRNCVLFSRESFLCYHDIDQPYNRTFKNEKLHLGVFCLEGECADLPPSAAYTGMFWPPPLWLHQKSKPIEMLQQGTDKFISRIQGAIRNPDKIVYLKRKFLEYVQFFQAMDEFIDAEVNTTKQILLKHQSSLQDKAEDVNCGTEESPEMDLSEEKLAVLADKQSKALEEVHGLVRQTFLQFERLMQIDLPL